MTDPVLAVIEEAARTPSPRVLALTEAIRARHPEGSIAGFLFYGSGLREADDPTKMLDLYVIAESYRAFHGSRMKAALNAALPPNVFQLEAAGPDGAPIRSKYAVLSMAAYERRVAEAFESTFWGRFAQSVDVVDASDTEAEARLRAGLAQSVRTFAREAQSLSAPHATALSFWTEALAASYRTELRAEDARPRAESIVRADLPRYQALTTALYGPPDAGGLHDIPTGPNRWPLRRFLGKPMTVLRILKAAFTFDGGADYALAKLEAHSGVRLEITDSQRRHPVLWSPVLLWKVLRSGAWR